MERRTGGKGRFGKATYGWLASLIAAFTLLLAAAPAQAANSSLFGLFPAQIPTNPFVSGPAIGPNEYAHPMVTWQGKNNSVIDFYDQLWPYDAPAAFQTTATTIWDDFRSVPMISLNTNPFSNSGIIRGDGDYWLTQWSQQLDQWLHSTDGQGRQPPPGGRRVYIRLDWEANQAFAGTNWAIPATNEGCDFFVCTCDQIAAKTAQYRQMWQHVHDLVMNVSHATTDQVQWVYSVYSFDDQRFANCPNNVGKIAANAYPGDNYVDWTGIDGYADLTALSPTNLQSPATVFGPMITELQGVAPTKPLSIDEMGASTWTAGVEYGTPAKRAQWITDFFNYVKTTPVKMFLWSNVDSSNSQYAVFNATTPTGSTYTSGGTTYNVYPQYATGVQDPYFIGTDPLANLNTSRLLTTAQFQGGF